LSAVTIALRIEPEDQTVDPGRPAVYTVHVVNQSGVVDRVALDVLGSAGAWSKADPPAVALFPGTDATATVVVTPPVGTPLGPVPIGIRATAETSGFVEVGEANLNVGASRTVDAELRPRTATGKRRATSVIVLHNVGNAPTKVQVVATDPDDAIVFDSPRAVEIGPGMTTELPLRMRLPSRERQGATLPYQVLVEGGDHGQSLDGQVRQPAKKRWPLIAAMAVLAALIAAFVLFKPDDSVALKNGTADEPTTTTVPASTTAVPGAPTTVPGAATTAAPGPGGGGGATTAKPPAGGGAATTKAPPVSINGASGGVIPTLAPTTTAPPICPGVRGGTPQQTAQRVVCTWEAGNLSSEVGQTITATAQSALDNAPQGGQVALPPSPIQPRGGTIVTFAGCPRPGVGKGVASVTVGYVSRQVESVVKCS